MSQNTFPAFNIKSFWLLLGYSFLMIMIALYNGFPLVESDSGAYISLGFGTPDPIDRTRFYGTFLGITSMHTTLWLTVYAQSFILCYLLRRYIKYLYPDVNAYSETFCFIAIISFTGVSWVAAYLMPDIFGAILLLAVLLYLFDASTGILQRALYIVIIALAIIVHNSHFLILAIFSTLFIIHAIISKARPLLVKSVALLCMSVLFWAAMCTYNYSKGDGFIFSKASHVFIVTRLAESGILGTYLHDNCDKKNLRICAYRDKIPAYSWDFMWNSESPLYKTGGWDSNRVEYNNIIYDVFTTPKYLQMFMEQSAISTSKELAEIRIADKVSPQAKDSAPWNSIAHYFNDELNEYTTSLQNNNVLEGGMANTIYYLFFILTSLWLLLYNRLLSKRLSRIYWSILLFFVINAFVTSVFSTIHYRYQNRIFWILPATNAIIIAGYYFTRYQKTGERYSPVQV